MKSLADLISTNDLEILLENVHAMIALVESDGTLVSWNHAFGSCKDLFPMANKLADLFSQQEKNQVVSNLNLRTKEHWVGRFPIPVNGEEVVIPCDCFLIPVLNERILFIAEEIRSDSVYREMERLNRQLELFQIENEVSKKLARNKQIEMEGVMIQAQEIAQIDALTFLFNRRRIVKELQDEILRAERYHSLLSVSVVDVDHFKAVNDTHGHLVGDEVLREVACQLRDHIRQPDMVGRFGGEEFLILLPNSDVHAAAEQAMRLGKQVRETTVNINNNEQKINVTISIGLAQFQHGVDTWETLLNRADTAMYEAKNSGRDRWAVAE